MAEEKIRRKRRMVGVVSSDKMDKTVVVTVTRRYLHPHYKKYVLQRAKYKAHDEKNDYRTGDRVQIVEAKPYSKQKRWRVAKLIERPETV